jgi:hypothetical protein
MADDKPAPPGRGGKPPRRFTRMELDPRGGPSRLIIDGVDLVERLAEVEGIIDLICAVTETVSDDVERLKKQRETAHTLADFARKGRVQKTANLQAEPWRIVARATAIAETKHDPTLRDAELKREILAALRDNGIEFNRTERTLDRLLEDMRKTGKLPPSPREK